MDFIRTGSLAFLSLVSCVSSDTSRPGDHGVSAVQFQDVVVPDGMKLQGSPESHSLEESGWRFGHFVYSGQPRIDDACSHLLLRMPQHLWRLTRDDKPDESTRKLRFTRGRYVADYTVHRQDGVTQMVIDYHTAIETR